MKELIKSKLEQHLWFRERKFRTRGFALYLKEKYKLEGITEGAMIDLVEDALAMDRDWRLVLDDNHPENHHLRGKDYLPEKKRLVQEKQIELGYESGGLQKIDI